MVDHHADRLHVRVDDRRTDEAEAGTANFGLDTISAQPIACSDEALSAVEVCLLSSAHTDRGQWLERRTSRVASARNRGATSDVATARN